jgi:hypothetical protein
MGVYSAPPDAQRSRVGSIGSYLEVATHCDDFARKPGYGPFSTSLQLIDACLAQATPVAGAALRTALRSQRRRRRSRRRSATSCDLLLRIAFLLCPHTFATGKVLIHDSNSAAVKSGPAAVPVKPDRLKQRCHLATACAGRMHFLSLACGPAGCQSAETAAAARARRPELIFKPPDSSCDRIHRRCSRRFKSAIVLRIRWTLGRDISPSAKMIPVTGAGTFSAVSAAKPPSSEERFSQPVRV